MLHLASDRAIAQSYFCMDRASTAHTGRREREREREEEEEEGVLVVQSAAVGDAGSRGRSQGAGGWRQVEARVGAGESAPCTSSTVSTSPARLGSGQTVPAQKNLCWNLINLKY